MAVSAESKLMEIKAGHRVWIGSYNQPRGVGIRSVARITPTQIVVDWNGDGSYVRRFHRDSGREVGRSMFADYVTGIATIHECAQFDREEAKKALKRKAAEHESQRIAALEAELSALLPINAHVQIHNGTFSVYFNRLTEDQVRSLANGTLQSALSPS